MNTFQANIYHFGDFRLDAGKRLLTRNGETIPLTPKVFDTLLYLVKHHGAVLDKNELMEAIWPFTVVEENNLNQTISALRRVFGESPGANRFIATVPGRGYSFVANVRNVVAESHNYNETNQTASKWKPIFSRRRSQVLALVLAVFAVGLAFVIRYIVSSANSVESTPLSGSVVHSTSHVKSVAVLPFKPLVSNFRDESLEMGMADTLIVRLGNLSELNVRSIGSVRRYSGLNEDPIAAGRALGVESVLEGYIQRSDERIRITARLLAVSDGRQLWAEQFDEKFTNVFTVQDLLSQKIVSALELKLTSEEQRQLTKHYTENSEAYELYISGRFYWEKRTVEDLTKAIEHFEKAIQKDPNYALAYAGLADAYALLGVFHLPPKDVFPKSREAALNALKIDDGLAEAHAALGHVKVQYEYDWVGAERQYKRAIELNPNNANARHFYAIYLLMMGRFNDGLAEILRARELDPFALFIHTHVAVAYYSARRYDEAISHAQKVLEMNPNIGLARSLLGRCYLEKGMYDHAIAEFRKQTSPSTATFGDLGHSYALAGRRDEALKEIEKLKKLSKQRYVSPHSIALIYAGLGDEDSALEWLEKAYEDRSTLLIWIKVDRRLDDLRFEPRFMRIVANMGL